MLFLAKLGKLVDINLIPTSEQICHKPDEIYFVDPHLDIAALKILFLIEFLFLFFIPYIQ